MTPDPLHGDRYRMIHGEALRTLLELPDAFAGAVVTDPPYSSGGFTRGDRMASTSNKYVLTGTGIQRPDFAGDNRDQRGYAKWCALWMDEALRITRPGGSLLVFTDWRQLAVTTDAVDLLRPLAGKDRGTLGAIKESMFAGPLAVLRG